VFDTIEPWSVDRIRQSGISHFLSHTRHSWADRICLSTGQHISELTNALRTLLLNVRTLEWDPILLRFFGLRGSVLARLVSTSEVYGNATYDPLKGVPLAGLGGNRQGALIGNKCLTQGQAKCTYGASAFLPFCTGTDIVYGNYGLLSMVRDCGSGSRR
jgi:glycerol kinase